MDGSFINFGLGLYIHYSDQAVFSRGRKSVGGSNNHLELKAESLMGPYWCRLEGGHSTFHRPRQ